MPKEIDIRKMKQDPLTRQKAPLVIPRGGLIPAECHEPRVPDTANSPTAITQSFISRFLDIMVCDVMQKLRLPLSEKQEDVVKKIRDFEKFEDFCKKARGER